MMKWITSAIAALTVLFAATSLAVVDEGVKEAKKQKSECASKCATECAGFSKKLNLSDEQVVKLTALKGECDGAGCKKSSAVKYQAGLQKILTGKQMAVFNKECEAGGGCKVKSATRLQASLAALTKESQK